MSFVTFGFVENAFGHLLGADLGSPMYVASKITTSLVIGFTVNALFPSSAFVEAFEFLSDGVDFIRSMQEGSDFGAMAAGAGLAGAIVGVSLNRLRAGKAVGRLPVRRGMTDVQVRIRQGVESTSAGRATKMPGRAPGRSPDLRTKCTSDPPGCFLAGTLVLTNEGRKKIEDIEVGDKVLARNDKTGEQGYKKVVRLFRGEADRVVHLKITPKHVLAKRSTRGRTRRRSHVSTRRRSSAKAKASEDGDGSGSGGDADDPDPDAEGAVSETTPAELSGLAKDATQTLLCTREHPFYVPGRGWVVAGKLAVGDELVDDHGEALVVTSWEIREQEVRHYNFEVEDWHTYFVAQTEEDRGVWVHNDCLGEDLNGNPVFAEVDFAKDPEAVLIATAKPSQARKNIIKHQYTNPGHHDPDLPKELRRLDYRGFKSVLPDNHVDLFKRSVAFRDGSGNVSARYTLEKTSDGYVWHQFQVNNQGGRSFHWAGSTVARTRSGNMPGLTLPRGLRARDVEGWSNIWPVNAD